MRTDFQPATEPAAGAPASGALYRSRVARSLAAYGLALALTLLVLTLALRLWNLDFHTPTNYGGDGTLHLMFTKGLVENGWFLTNPSLGAPGEMDLREFPAVDILPALLIKGLALFTHDPALLNNLFFLLTFPLTSLAAFYACRQFGFLAGPSLLCALLYAFMPYHFSRSEGHLYLSAYFMTPLAVLVAWWVAEGRLLGPAGAWWRGKLPLAAGICVLDSLSGVYYPFFSGMFLVTASLLALCVRRDWRHFVAGGLLAALLAAGMLACLLPTLAYLRGHPGYPAALRQSSEAEIYGLKIVQVLLPIDGHRLGVLEHFKDHYNRHSPLVTENTTAAVGVVGAAGFLGLIGWLLFRPLARAGPPAGGEAEGCGPPPGRRFLDTFSVFNAVAVLFGTIGGFGELFALLVTPQVRALNRISVFIDFFALAAVAFCLDALARRRGSPAARALVRAGLGGLLLLGLFDQTRPINPAAYRLLSHDYRADRDFFRRAAASLPPGAMVFQLPYMGFPENGPEERLQDYSLFDGYLLSDGLRWSYGAMRDNPADQWQQAVACLPVEAGVRQLALGGFSGVHVERAGYADFGAALEAKLRVLLGPPTATESERLFFSLLDYTRALRATMTPEQWRQAADLARHRVYVSFDTGFRPPVRTPETTSCGCLQNSTLTLTNPSGQTREIRLRMLASTTWAVPVTVVMTSGNIRQTWTLDQQPQARSVSLDLPPGKGSVRFSCDVGGRASTQAWVMADLQIDQDESPRDSPDPAAPPVSPPTPAAAAGPPGAP